MVVKNELLRVIKFMLYVTQFFGFYSTPVYLLDSPATVISSHSQNNCNLLLKVYTLTWALIIGALPIIFSKTAKTGQVDIVLRLSDDSVYVSNLLLFLVALLSNYLNRKHINKSITNLITIGNILRKNLSLNVGINPLKNYVYTQVFVTIFTCVLFACFYIFVSCPNSSTSFCFAYFVSFHFLVIVNHMHTIQLTTLFVLIGIYYEALNEKLQQLCYLPSMNNAWKLRYAQTKSNVNNVSMKKFLAENAQSEATLAISANKCEELLVIRRLHSFLSEYTKNINDAFTFPLLCSVANGFIAIFCSIYSCLFGVIIQGEVIKHHEFKYSVIPLITLVLAMLRVLTITLVCEKLVNKSQRAGSIIYKMPLNKDDDDDMKKNIQNFSLQLINERFTITAFGFFNVDCTLLQTIIGAVTTYLVILIQFDMTIHSDKNKSSNTA